MHVLIADRNALLLESISLTFTRGFTIRTATTTRLCAELLLQIEFDLAIVSEKLADGPGLRLLGKIARDSPKTLRILVARGSRLELLEGRLGALGLFGTLAYPIEHRKLLAALTSARWRTRPPPSPHARPRTIPSQPIRAPVREMHSRILLGATVSVAFLVTMLSLTAPAARIPTIAGSRPHRQLPEPQTAVRPSEPAAEIETHAQPERVAMAPHAQPAVVVAPEPAPRGASDPPMADPSAFGSEAYEAIYPN